LFGENDDSSQLLYESLFRPSNGRYYCDGSAPTARTVCLDTEPKVIESCLAQASTSTASWKYDPKSVLFRHGGAGNNWALGYAMASGEFLEKSLECIRRELEHCDDQTGLVFLHSLAGGTGSGLGTHITEACEDMFATSFRSNIVVAPHHFGEVVVQHYNAMLCLSKVHDSSDGIILFENEMAQLLSKEMHGIEKPLLKDLNQVIASNLLTLFLPKRTPTITNSPFRGTVGHQHFFDDLSFLCAHPGYRFAQIRLTPQTSKRSIEFTFDSWTALLKTIQRMQLSSTLLERHVRPEINALIRRREQVLEMGRPSPTLIDDDKIVLNKSLASIVSCHGEQSDVACQKLAIPHFDPLENNNNINNSNRLITPKKSSIQVDGSVAFTARTRGTITTAAAEQQLQLYNEYHECHSDILTTVEQSNLRFQCSPFLVNRYKRSVSTLSNDQAILPILQRSLLKCHDMFEVGAYVHQYTSNGMDYDDFLTAFHSVGSIVHNYANL
jgi:hypothetical protein